jgi:hypothetical protein
VTQKAVGVVERALDCLLVVVFALLHEPGPKTDDLKLQPAMPSAIPPKRKPMVSSIHWLDFESGEREQPQATLPLSR